MNDIIPEGTSGAGGTEKVELTKTEYDTLTQKLADKVQAEVNMTQELIDLRKKNQELKGQTSPVPAEDISKAVDAKLAERDAESLKEAQRTALESFLDSHPEFSKEEDTDGTKFAAFQKALSRINLTGVKSQQDYAEVLEDALRLSGQTSTVSSPSYTSAPRNTYTPPSSRSSMAISPSETKLVQNNFGGNVEAYLKVKTKRPEYIEELLRWVR